MLKDILLYLPSRAVPAITAFLLNILIFSRMLTPDEYGLYTLVIIITTIIGTILFRWINESALRYYEKYSKQKKKEFISTYVFIILLAGLFIIALFFFVRHFLSEFIDTELLKLLSIGVFLIILKPLFDLFLTLKRADFQKVRYSLISSLFAVGKFLLAVLILYYTDFRVNGLIASLLIAYLIFIIIELFSHIKQETIKPIISFSLVRNSMKFGLPLTGVFIMGLLLAIIDKLFIAYFLGPQDLGIYSMGYKISEMSIQNIFMVLLLPAYPAIIKTFENEGKYAAGKSLKKYISIYFVFLVPIVVILWGMAKEFCIVFLGNKFQDSFVVFGLIAASIFIWGLSHYIVKIFLLLENTKKIFLYLMISVLINIILNTILIPNLGIIGAAYSTLISYSIYLLISYADIKKKTKFPIEFPWYTIFKTTIAAGFMLIVIIILPTVNNTWGFLFKLALSLIIYFLLLTLFKERNIIGFLQTAKNYLK